MNDRAHRTQETPAQQPGHPLLHNMSAPARAHISHRSAFRRPPGRAVVFALPGGYELSAELARLAPGAGPRDRAERRLRRLIDAHALTLDLPAAAVVADQSEQGDETCQDILSVITVLAKSSGRVYLRDKEPNLARLRPGARAILILPSHRSSK